MQDKIVFPCDWDRPVLSYTVHAELAWMTELNLGVLHKQEVKWMQETGKLSLMGGWVRWVWTIMHHLREWGISSPSMMQSKNKNMSEKESSSEMLQLKSMKAQKDLNNQHYHLTFDC